MSRNLLRVSAPGIENHLEYVNIIRQREDELAANGMDYEEFDQRAEPVSAALIISIAVTTIVTTALAEVVKKIVNETADAITKRRLKKSETDEPKQQAGPVIILLRIGGDQYELPKDRDAAIAKIQALPTAAEPSR